jgi:hypothetical protein
MSRETKLGTPSPICAPAASAVSLTTEMIPFSQVERASPMRAVAAETVAAAIPIAEH